MTTISLLSATLGLAAPWELTDARFSETENRVDMVIEFSGGSTFPCPACGMSATICSVNHETWHHPTFFRFSAYLHARIPSVECCRCGTHRIPPTWIPASSGFVPFSGDHSA